MLRSILPPKHVPPDFILQNYLPHVANIVGEPFELLDLTVLFAAVKEAKSDQRHRSGKNTCSRVGLY